jgi:Tfp pilus assembly protein PilV
MSFVQIPKTSLASKKRRGFTLIEAALVTTIISFGVLAMLQLLAVGTVSNSDGAEMSTAINLAKGVRELMVGMPIADPQTPTHWGAESRRERWRRMTTSMTSMARPTTRPSMRAARTISEFPDWTQTIKVQTVDPNLLTSTVPNGTTAAVRVTVTVSRNGKAITSYSWVAFDAVP